MERKYTITVNKGTGADARLALALWGYYKRLACNDPIRDTTMEDSLNRIGAQIDELKDTHGELPRGTEA